MRKFPIGAEPGEAGTHFRVWAPAARRLEVVERSPTSDAAGKSHLLERSDDGYFSGSPHSPRWRVEKYDLAYCQR